MTAASRIAASNQVCIPERRFCSGSAFPSPKSRLTVRPDRRKEPGTITSFSYVAVPEKNRESLSSVQECNRSIITGVVFAPKVTRQPELISLGFCAGDALVDDVCCG